MERIIFNYMSEGLFSRQLANLWRESLWYMYPANYFAKLQGMVMGLHLESLGREILQMKI